MDPRAKVHFIGGGPGAPELLTLRAAEVIVDVVIWGRNLLMEEVVIRHASGRRGLPPAPRWSGRVRGRSRSRLGALSAVIAAATALAACGGDDLKESGGRLAPEDTKLSRLDISVTEPTAGRFRYLAPRSVRGGLVEIRLTNLGKNPRKAQLWRVGEGHSVREALRRRRPLPRWLTWAGGVGLTRPNQTGTAIQQLPAGNYYIAGAGSERGDVAPLRVTQGRDGGLPKADTRVTAVDYGYEFSGLKAGPTALEFVNTGKEPHHAFFAPMQPEVSLDEVKEFFAGKSVGPPPVDPEATKETVVLEGGGRQVTRLDLESGRYAVLCFVSDRAGGPPHTEKGMVAEVKVP